MSKYLEISIHVKEQRGDFRVLILFAKRVKVCFALFLVEVRYGCK